MTKIREITTMNQWRAPAIALALFFSAVSAWAENAIQAINSSQQGAADVVRIELSEALGAVPAGFAVQTPPRIAIDLPGVSNALGRSSVDVNQGNLRSVNVAQAGDRTRLVLNLKQPGNYSATLDGKTLVLTLQTSGNVAAAPTAAAPVAAQRRRPRYILPTASMTRRKCCAPSISAAARTVPVASWSICPATRSVSTFASRARTWWLNS